MGKLAMSKVKPCEDHPGYMAIQEPRNNCPFCWEMYVQAQKTREKDK